ncbi:MAG: S-layer homology domain-containing protein, partial [Clostridia bacterium]|nr:S-layer homology domain-containing protein [Clostridia bacterium]
MKILLRLLLLTATALILAASANAAFGVVVEAERTYTQPNMEYIDESWGDPVISNITSASENVYLWQFYATDYEDKAMGDGVGTAGTGPNGRPSWKPEDNPIDLYMRWDDTYFYFAFRTKDYDLNGYPSAQRGDGCHFWIQPADSVDDPGEGATVFMEHIWYNPFLYVWGLSFDDWSTGTRISEPGATTSAAALLDIPAKINVDPGEVGEDGLQGLIAIPWENLYPRKAERAKAIVDGAEFGIAFLRVSATSNTCLSLAEQDVKTDNGITGGIVWGKYLKDNPPNQKYLKPTNTSLNTVILRDPNASGNAETEGTADTTANAGPNLDGVSGWALAEVEAGIKEGLVPGNLQANYTSPVTRGAVAQMFVNLLEKAAGKSIDDIIAEKGLSINPVAFTDTTDKAVLAANALGIINGTGSGKFSPDGTLKRAQIAAIINRVARVMGIETDGFT